MFRKVRSKIHGVKDVAQDAVGKIHGVKDVAQDAVGKILRKMLRKYTAARS